MKKNPKVTNIKSFSGYLYLAAVYEYQMAHVINFYANYIRYITYIHAQVIVPCKAHLQFKKLIFQIHDLYMHINVVCVPVSRP